MQKPRQSSSGTERGDVVSAHHPAACHHATRHPPPAQAVSHEGRHSREVSLLLSATLLGDILSFGLLICIDSKRRIEGHVILKTRATINHADPL